VAEKGDTRINLLLVDLGKGIVDEADALQPRSGTLN